MTEIRFIKYHIFGSKETSVTATSIVSKSFELKNAREFMEEQFSRLGEDKSSYVSQGKQKNGKKKYT